MLQNENYEHDVEYSIRFPRFILRILGAWPETKKHTLLGKLLNTLPILVSYSILYFILVPGLLHMFVVEKNPRKRVYKVGPFIYCVMTIAKYTYLLLRENEIRTCLWHLKNDWKNVIEKYTRDTMLISARTGRRLCLACGAFMYVSGLSVRTIVPLSKGKIITDQNITLKPLAFPSYIGSFDPRISPAYEIVFTIQCLSGFITYSVTTGACGMASLFVMHACGQLEILMRLMREFVKAEVKNVDEKLAILVEHQIRIRNFLQLVNSCLQQICLVEVLGCTIIICLLGYCTLTEWENHNKLAMFSYIILLVSMSTNIFMFCYTGEQLNTQLEKVSVLSCALEWYQLPERKARSLILVIIVSNSPTRLTAGKVIDLSFKTFGDVMKTAVTYLNMLQTVTN